MTANEFDELVARLTDGASRRAAVRGIVGGAIASVGAASVADAKRRGGKGKGKKKDGKQAAGETNAIGNHRRVFCFCPNITPTICRTRRVKTKKFNKLFRKHRSSSRGPCQTTTTTTTTQGPTPTTTTTGGTT